MPFPVTPSNTPTNTPTQSVTPSNTPTNTPTQSSCPQATPTPTSTITATPGFTASVTPTPTITPSNTPSQTATQTATPTLTQTPTSTIPECLCFSSVTVDVTSAGSITFDSCIDEPLIESVNTGNNQTIYFSDCIQKNTNGGTAEYSIISYNDCCVPSVTPSPTPTFTSTPTQTPTITSTSTQTPTPSSTIGSTPSQTPTQTQTPTATSGGTFICECWSFENTNEASADVQWDDCNGGPSLQTIPAGNTIYKCVVSGSTPTGDPGVVLTPCGVSCSDICLPCG